MTGLNNQEQLYVCGGDNGAGELQETVRRIKADREMGAKYMTFQQFIKDERKEAMEIGRAEGATAKLIEQIQKKVEKGQSVEQIADAVEESIEVVEKLIREYALL